jgi:hypothetical protein
MYESLIICRDLAHMYVFFGRKTTVSRNAFCFLERKATPGITEENYVYACPSWWNAITDFSSNHFSGVISRCSCFMLSRSMSTFDKILAAAYRAILVQSYTFPEASYMPKAVHGMGISSLATSLEPMPIVPEPPIPPTEHSYSQFLDPIITSIYSFPLYVIFSNGSLIHQRDTLQSVLTSTFYTNRRVQLRLFSWRILYFWRNHPAIVIYIEVTTILQDCTMLLIA